MGDLGNAVFVLTQICGAGNLKYILDNRKYIFILYLCHTCIDEHVMLCLYINIIMHTLNGLCAWIWI